MGKQIFLAPIDADDDDLPPVLKEFYVERIDGNFILHLETEDGHRVSTLIRNFNDAAWLQHEASQALAAMIADTLAAPYPAVRFSEAMRRAARPNANGASVRFDPTTGNYNYHLPFPKRAPLSMSLTETDINILRAKQQAALAVARIRR